MEDVVVPRMVDDQLMIADLTGESYGYELLSEMSKMATFQITRTRALDWARSLVFITVDEEAPSESVAAKEDLSLEAPSRASPGPQVIHNKQHECDQCRHLPTFPPKTRRFRLTRSSCSHFLAVSYCWPKDSEGRPTSTSQTYQYRDANGNEPRLRPPDDVVDRAIAYARLQGIRQLWIDQVSLPQDDSLEHQLGIQGIDLVYQRAHSAIGLYETVITEQRQLDAFRAVLYWRRSGLMIQDDRTATLLIEFLNLLSNDQWNTRAWILQEAFAAGTKMIISVRTAAGIQFNDEWGLLRVPQYLQDTFLFVLDDLHALLRVCREYLTFIADEAEKQGHAWLRQRLEQQSHDALEGLASIRPAAADGADAGGWSIDGGRQFGTRETCNAAVALSYLRSRESHPPADRLAILANLCDFEIRLDTRKLRQFTSLATAFFALALMNGDLSLLNPDLYATFIQHAPHHVYRWCPPFQSILWNINSIEVQPGAYICPRLTGMYHLSGEGFKCPAILWAINEKVDLSMVQEKWQREWQSHLVKDLTITRFPLETPEEYRTRREIVNKYIDDHPDQLNEDTKDPFLRENTRIKMEFNIDHLHRASAIKMIEDIFADILRALHDTGYISLANSIWHSIRRAELEQENPTTENEPARALPDDVVDLVAGTLLEDSKSVIQLDWSKRGSFFQVWIIERIMRNGFLWAGHGVPLGQDCTNTPTVRATAEEAGCGTGEEALRNETAEHSGGDTFLERTRARQLMIGMMRTGAGGHGDNMVASSAASEMMRLRGTGYTWDDEVRRQMVVFDVDGPATVATPLDRDLERLPHPKDRSMRVSWVVEHAPKPDMALDARIGDDSNHSDLLLDATDRTASDDTPRSDSVIESSASVPWSFNRDRYHVLTKVKGCWPLVENLPRGAYLFV